MQGSLKWGLVVQGEQLIPTNLQKPLAITSFADIH